MIKFYQGDHKHLGMGEKKEGNRDKTVDGRKEGNGKGGRRVRRGKREREFKFIISCP